MIGQKLILLDSVDSTNNYAAKLLSEGKIAHGTVILADKQTDGKGQRGNKWQTGSEKQFICSVFLKTAFLSVERYWYLNLAVANAVRNTIAHYIPDLPLIKWPNDVLVNDRKVAGILIETHWNAGKIHGVVAGVGINIHSEAALPRGGALSDSMETLPEALEMSRIFTGNLEIQFELLRKGDWNSLMNEYLRNLWKLNQVTEVEISGRRMSGTIRGLNENGNLLLETEGATNAYDLKEVVFHY